MNTPVIDFHNHVGRWANYFMDDDADAFLRIMDAAGVDQACVFNIFHGEAWRCNDSVAAFVARHPDRFIGFAFVTPHYLEEAIPGLERAFDQLDMKALKIYPPYFPKPVTDPTWFPIFEWANDRRVVVISHTSCFPDHDEGCQPLMFIELAQRFPKVRWVLGHAGVTDIGVVQAVEAVRACPNIYLETCTSYGREGTIEFLVEEAGADRILYGSDMPLLDTRFQIGRIVTADISDEAKCQILGLNALRLLGIEEE